MKNSDQGNESDSREIDSLIDLVSLRILFSNCVISDIYRLNPAIPHAIRLSPAGQRHLKEICRRQPTLAVTDAKMLTFLEMDSTNGLLVEGTGSDLVAIQKALSEAIKSQKIFFPWTYGRLLSDRLISLFGVKPTLNNAETITLLESSPQGVFQVGRYVVGPFGCLESPIERAIFPTKMFDGYVEIRGGERAFKKFRLRTGDKAPINKAAKVDEDLKLREGSLDTRNRENYRALSIEFSKRVSKPPHFQDEILKVLGETLSDSEVKSVLAHFLPMMFKREGGRRTLEKRLGIVLGDPHDFIHGLTRQQIQQLFHLGSNEELYRSVEQSISLDEIRFSGNFSRFSSNMRGRSSIRLELTAEGVRNASWLADSLFSVNALDMLYEVFVESGVKKPDDLRFRLNSQETDTDILIREALLSWSVDDFVGYLCGDFDLAIFCANKLGIFEPEKLGTDDLRRKMLYKLGAPDLRTPPQIEEFQKLLSAFSQLDGSDGESLTSSSANLFKCLETILFDVTVFLKWALTSPMKSQDHQYEFNLDQERAEYRAFAGVSSLTLRPLIDGLSALRNELLNLPKEEMIPLESYSSQKKQSQPEVFRFRRMFLNLNLSSQNAVIQILDQVFELLSNDVVTSIRNRSVHGNQTQRVSRSEIMSSSENVGLAVETLHRSGMIPSPWTYVGSSKDINGLTKVSYINGREECAILLPLLGNAPGLPSRKSSLFIISCAELAYAGPLRFAVAEPRVDEEDWVDFPAELKIGTEAMASTQFSEDRAEVA
jgi:hypothetical protein